MNNGLRIIYTPKQETRFPNKSRSLRGSRESKGLFLSQVIIGLLYFHDRKKSHFRQHNLHYLLPSTQSALSFTLFR